MGYKHIFHFYGSVGPLECIFMALLALFNEGVPTHFFHLMEAPTMRLQNAKILLHWPSRMHIYGIATVPYFRRGRHRRQSGAIVEEGMGPDD